MAECSDFVNFDHTRQGIKFYMCCECKMHIALVGDNDMAVRLFLSNHLVVLHNFIRVLFLFSARVIESA